MYIPPFIQEAFSSSESGICPSQVVNSLLEKRSVDSVIHDAKSGWNSCMDKTWCKVVVIVGIVIGSLILIWLLQTIIRVLCCGAQCIGALCCCCCGSDHRTKETIIYAPPPPAPTSQGAAYSNPNMYYQQKGEGNPFSDDHHGNKFNKQQQYYG